MRLKQLLTMLIAALLLGTTCAASACELACDFKITGPACHATTTKAGEAQGQMDGMQHYRDKASVKSLSFHSADAGACPHSVCRQQPQLLEADRQSALLQARSFQNVLIASVLTYPLSPKSGRVRRFQSPPPRSPLLVSFQTILRV